MATDDKRYGKNNQLNDSSGPPAAPPGSWQPGPPKPPPPTTQTLEPLALPTGGPNVPPAARGAVRFSEEIRRSGLTPGSPEYENFILGMKPDPADTEYTTLVAQQQDQVKKTVLERQKNEAAAGPLLFAEKAAGGLGRGALAGFKAGGGKFASPSRVNERDLDVSQKRQATPYLGGTDSFVGYGGSDTAADKASLGNSVKPGSQSSDTASDGEDTADYEDVTDSQYIAAGGAVWVGDRPASPRPGVSINQATYRNAADMMNDVYRWDTAQTAAFQKNLGLDVNGVADEKTVAAWKWAVNTARYYTAMGQKRSIDSILQQAKQTSGGGGGGGGGGGSGTSVPADQAKRILNQVMKEYAGREATDVELKAFLPAIRAVAGSDDFDATQFTTDWVRGGSNGARSGEVASYQAGTDYYSVVQQLIGGQ